MTFEKNLIELVKNHEIIFNLKLKDYRNLGKKKKIWSEIAMTLNTTADVCKKRWKNLRDSYRKSKKQDLPSGSGAPDAVKKWKYFDQMRFLDEFECFRVAIGNIPLNAGSSEESDATDPLEIIMEEGYKINLNESASTEGDILFSNFPIASTTASESSPAPRISTSSSRAPRASALLTSSSRASALSTSSTAPPLQREQNISYPEEFKVLLESTSQAIKAIVPSIVKSQSTTEAVFMTLARKIDENNLPPQVVNEIEMHVISYVYEKIKNNQK